ncbi:MAG: type II secretion system protein GspN [Desulfobacterales bacterium]
MKFSELKIAPSKKALIYAAYILGITLIFLYFLFPSDTVKDYVVYQLRGANPEFGISIERVSPVIPPGIKLHAVGISRGNQALFDFESVKITPGLLSLFSSRKTARFTGRVSAGNVLGRVEIDSRNDQGMDKIEGTISGVRVQGIPALQHLTPHKISGSLDGEFQITRSGPNRSMTSQLILSDCRIDFDQPIIGQPSMGFKNIAANLVLHGGNLVIKKCQARGSDLDADISGTIALDGSRRREALNLSGSVMPHHGFLAKIEKSIPSELLRRKSSDGEAISFKIGGTVNAPQFRLN